MDATEKMVIELERRLAFTDVKLARLEAQLELVGPQLAGLTAAVTTLNKTASEGRGIVIALSLVASAAGALFFAVGKQVLTIILGTK
jgi:hypothetical protein